MGHHQLSAPAFLLVVDSKFLEDIIHDAIHPIDSLCFLLDHPGILSLAAAGAGSNEGPRPGRRPMLYYAPHIQLLLILACHVRHLDCTLPAHLTFLVSCYLGAESLAVTVVEIKVLRSSLQPAVRIIDPHGACRALIFGVSCRSAFLSLISSRVRDMGEGKDEKDPGPAKIQEPTE